MTKNRGLWLIVSVLIANWVLGFEFRFYNYSWFDIILHFLGGLGVFWIFESYFAPELSKTAWYKYVILLAGSVVLIGVLWEFAEYAASVFWGTAPNGYGFIGDLTDTLSDLCMDLLGGLAGILLHFLGQRKS